MTTQLLSAGQLTLLQNAVARTFPDTCDVLRYASAPDGAGGITETWTTAHSAVPCRVTDYEGRKGGEEDQKDARYDTVLWWRFHLPAATDVTAKDRLLYAGRTFEVLSVGGGKSFQVEWVVMTAEIT